MPFDRSRSAAAAYGKWAPATATFPTGSACDNRHRPQGQNSSILIKLVTLLGFAVGVLLPNEAAVARKPLAARVGDLLPLRHSDNSVPVRLPD